MSPTDEFLEAFKSLETAIRSEYGYSPLEYESNVSTGLEADRLKICRITRNFIAHNEKGFAVPTKDMISFVKELDKKISLSKGSAKDAMISLQKFGCVCEGDTLQDYCMNACCSAKDFVAGIKKLSEKNHGMLACVSDDGKSCKLIPILEIVSRVATTHTKQERSMRLGEIEGIQVPEIGVDTPYADVPEDKLILVKDMKTGKYKGIIRH